MDYRIGVVSKEHVQRGVEGGFCQVCHGKKAPLARMKEGDYLLYYSSKFSRTDKEPYQSFTAFGQMKDDHIYQFAMSDDFIPFRRDVHYHEIVRECPIDYARQHPEWPIYAKQLRYGHIKVSREFFNAIAKYMIKKS